MLIDEKLGFTEVEKDDRPGPQKIDGYTVDIYVDTANIFEPCVVDRVCRVETGDWRVKTVDNVEYADGSIVENDERVVKLL